MKKIATNVQVTLPAGKRVVTPLEWDAGDEIRVDWQTGRAWNETREKRRHREPWYWPSGR